MISAMTDKLRDQYKAAVRAYRERRFEEAFVAYKEIAEGGDSETQRLIGWMYSKGRGVEQDYKEAIHWLSRAAPFDDGESNFILGGISESMGDFDNASKNYEISISRGYLPSYYRLSIILESGNVVSKETREPIDLLRF